MKKIPKF